MLTHPTLDQLRQLGLAGMARAFEDLQSRSGGELAPVVQPTGRTQNS